MSSAITNKVAQIIAKRALNDIKAKKININSQNPFEEQYDVLDKHGRPTGKTKTRKRGIPPSLSAHDAQVLKRVRRRAYHLDMSLFNCCGIRFGWSSVVAIIPVIGDCIDVLMALMVVHLAEKIEGGLPKTLRAQMYFNIVVDFGLGLVPILGDVADAIFRANTRNAWLLETYLVKKLEAQRAGAVTDPESGKTLPAPPPPAQVAGDQGTSHGGHEMGVMDVEHNAGLWQQQGRR